MLYYYENIIISVKSSVMMNKRLYYMDNTLRYYLPIAGPGTREPCKGNESSFRICLGFTPKWYRDRLKID